jgi:hypothetical protein
MNIIDNPTTTVDLGSYFFQGDDFHWRNVAITLAEWLDPGWKNEKHGAGMDTATRDAFWIDFEQVELCFCLDYRDTVEWGHTKWSGGPEGFEVTTPLILPTDPDQLLTLLGLQSHSQAGDIAKFWLKLQTFLPYLSDIIKDVELGS